MAQQILFFLIAAHLGLTAAQSTVQVNLKTRYQVIDGFGMSEAFWQASTVQGLESTAQKSTLDLFFSTTAGAGLSILRNRIGASGVGDSIEPTSPGSPTAIPTYDWGAYDAGQYWLTQQARSYGVRYIYADAWTAPGFMKTNNDQANGGYLCGLPGENCTTGDWRQAYANFLAQYITYYEQANLTIDFVGFLNEPELTTSYESMLMNGTQAASFIPILSNTLKSKNITTGIACCDSMGWDNQVAMNADIKSAGADKYLSRVTSHWYSSQCSAPMSTNLRVWQTEYCDLGSEAWTTAWYASGAAGEGMTWANYIHTGLTTCNLSAYLYWWGSESNATGNGILVNLDNGSPVASARLWAFGMFSRYVRPDAVRVASSAAPAGVNSVAFQNADGSVPVVFINTNSTSQSISISLNGLVPSRANAYILSNAATGIQTTNVTLSNHMVSVKVPAYAMVTVVIKGNMRQM